jgi:hypothetical protein
MTTEPDTSTFRDDLPPLDMATNLIGGARYHVAFAKGIAKGRGAGRSDSDKSALDVIQSVLDSATEKLMAAQKMIREFQQIPGNN